MKNQNESLDESDFEYMQAERDVWKARYEFACADRKKLLSDNAGLVKNQESNTAAFLAMREDRDALMLANTDLCNWFDALKADYDKLLAADARVPMTDDDIEKLWLSAHLNGSLYAFDEAVKIVESHYGIKK